MSERVGERTGARLPLSDREPTRCRMEGELPEDPRVADKRLSTHIR